MLLWNKNILVPIRVKMNMIYMSIYFWFYSSVLFSKVLKNLMFSTNMIQECSKWVGKLWLEVFVTSGCMLLLDLLILYFQNVLTGLLINAPQSSLHSLQRNIPPCFGRLHLQRRYRRAWVFFQYTTLIFHYIQIYQYINICYIFHYPNEDIS